MAEEGYAAPSQVHDIAGRPRWRPGSTPTSCDRSSSWPASSPGNRLDADHPLRQLLDAQLAEADGDVEARRRLYAAAAGSSTDEPRGLLARHRGTAHVGAARCLIALGRLDEARAARRRPPPSCLAAGAGGGSTSSTPCSGGSASGPSSTGPEALTPREREVAALLAEGLSNAGLAERLYISPRTAAVHVSNILTKLGMGSRTEVAAWAVREGLAADERDHLA